jgi:thiol-disulfide isomerase/thioredoxin
MSEGEAAPSAPRSRLGWVGRALVLAVAVIALVNLLLVVRAPRGRYGGPSDGKEAPAFSGTLAAGGRGALADYRGKVVLLDFWATWCEPCVAEMPVLARVQRRFGAAAGPGGAFTVLGINVDGGGPPGAEVAAFLRERGLSVPTFVDDGAIAALYHVDTIPSLLLLDRQGHVRQAWNGGASEAELARSIEPLLK